MPLTPFGPELWIADGETVDFYGFPYPTRMAVVRLSQGRLWLWSPTAWNPTLGVAIDALGTVRCIVTPNKLHHLYLEQWAQRYPHAQLHAAPGLKRRKPRLAFTDTLGEDAAAAWAGTIHQSLFGGSLLMSEVVFLHQPSRTLIVGDLIQRHEPRHLPGWKEWAMRLDGLVGPRGSTPREWRLSFLRRDRARRARDQVLARQPDRLVVAHGTCAEHGATAIVRDALAWI